MKLDEIRDIDRVYVFKQKDLAGTLSRTSHGSVFEYSPDYLEKSRRSEVALTLPLSKPRVTTTGDNLPPFFAGLLPEGRRLTALISALKTSSDDMFSILAASGPDCVGDVFVSLSSKPDSTRTQQPLEDSDSVSFHDLFERSISSPEYSVRLQDSSVPGIHPKLSAEMISFPLTVKKRKKRYILKLAPAKFPKLVENEFFFTQMARACGINAAESKIIHDKTGQSGLLVERFDRYYDEQTKQILSIHQEDACQFLDRYPQDKYRLPMRSIANGLKLYCTAPVLEIGKLIALKAFSYLILNGDLHAKNISIVSEPRTERIVLSPAYDLVSTLPYGNNQMALEFEGRRDNLKLRDFISFGAAFGVRDKAVRAIIEDLRSAARPFVDRLSEIGLDSKQTAHLRREMLERLKDLD